MIMYVCYEPDYPGSTSGVITQVLQGSATSTAGLGSYIITGIIRYDYDVNYKVLNGQIVPK